MSFDGRTSILPLSASNYLTNVCCFIKYFRFLSFRSRAVPNRPWKSTLTFYNLYLAKQNIQKYNLLRQRKQDRHCKMLLLIWMMLLFHYQRFVLLSFLFQWALCTVITFSSNQDGYRDILKMADNFSSFNQRLRYAHLRPSLPVKSDPRAWWKYAYKVVTHEIKKSRYLHILLRLPVHVWNVGNHSPLSLNWLFIRSTP